MATEVKWSDGNAILAESTIRWSDGDIFGFYYEAAAANQEDVDGTFQFGTATLARLAMLNRELAGDF